MHDFIRTEVFSITLTLGLYFVFTMLYARIRFFLLNPILLTTVSLIAFLVIFSVDYTEYNAGGKYISFFLQPAVVALGLPLYNQLETIKKNGFGIIISILAGSVIGIVSVIVFARMFGASRGIILSMVPKSVTTPIAMDIAATLGGIPPLTAGIVVTVGILGAITGLSFLKLIRVRKAAALGLAMGAAAHGLGTAKVAELGEEHSAYGGLAIALNGIMTAFLSPWIVKILGFMIY